MQTKDKEGDRKEAIAQNPSEKRGARRLKRQGCGHKGPQEGGVDDSLAEGQRRSPLPLLLPKKARPRELLS